MHFSDSGKGGGGGCLGGGGGRVGGSARQPPPILSHQEHADAEGHGLVAEAREGDHRSGVEVKGAVDAKKCHQYHCGDGEGDTNQHGQARRELQRA